MAIASIHFVRQYRRHVLVNIICTEKYIEIYCTEEVGGSSIKSGSDGKYMYVEMYQYKHNLIMFTSTLDLDNHPTQTRCLHLKSGEKVNTCEIDMKFNFNKHFFHKIVM